MWTTPTTSCVGRPKGLRSTSSNPMAASTSGHSSPSRGHRRSSSLHIPASRGREVPGRHAIQRRSGQVQLRAHARPQEDVSTDACPRSPRSDAANESTVRFTLEGPSTDFMYTMTQMMMSARRQSRPRRELTTTRPEGAADNIVGPGPFLDRKSRKEQRDGLKPQQDYWRGWQGNHLEQVVVRWSRSQPRASSARKGRGSPRSSTAVHRNRVAQEHARNRDESRQAAGRSRS